MKMFFLVSVFSWLTTRRASLPPSTSQHSPTQAARTSFRSFFQFAKGSVPRVFANGRSPFSTGSPHHWSSSSASVTVTDAPDARMSAGSNESGTSRPLRTRSTKVPIWLGVGSV
jgi:hypothetical protein